jgi:hypothetical protein
LIPPRCKTICAPASVTNPERYNPAIALNILPA